MRRVGVGLAFTAALLGGCGSSAERSPAVSAEAPNAASSAPVVPTQTASAAPTLPPQPTYEQERAELVSSFDAVKSYWISQGVDVSGTKLVIIEDSQSEQVCGSTYSGTQPGGGYCRSFDTVFFTQELMRYIGSDDLLPRTPYDAPRMEVSAAHEVGHAVQYARGDTPTVQAYQANPRIYENQADCYAGRAVHAISPNLGPTVMSIYFQYLPGSDAGQPDIYGTTAERKAEFVSGYSGGACIAGQ